MPWVGLLRKSRHELSNNGNYTSRLLVSLSRDNRESKYNAETQDGQQVRYCELGGRAYGLRSQDGGSVRAEKVLGEGGVHHYCSLPSIQGNSIICKLGRGYRSERDIYLSVEIMWRLQRVEACFQRYNMEIYVRPGVRLRLKVRMPKAEVT